MIFFELELMQDKSAVQKQIKLVYIISLCTVLAGVQGTALRMQFHLGFRPVHHSPQRVAFSWDMFAIAIERCTVDWTPPLSIDGKSVARWQDRNLPLEFDSVFNRAADYEVAAKRACVYKTNAMTTALITCAGSDGQVHERTLRCP